MLWGMLYPAVKLGYRFFNIASDDIFTIIFFAGLRFIISGIIMIAFFSKKNKRFFVFEKGSINIVLLIGFISIALHYSITYIGLSLIDGSKASILKQAGFLFLICFSGLFFAQDKFNFNKIIGGILGFISIVIINIDGMSLHFSLGDILILGASFLIALSNIISKKVYIKYNPLNITAYSQLSGGLIMIIIGMVFGGIINVINVYGIFLLLYICVSSISAYALWSIVVKEGDLSKLSVIKFTEPIFAIIFSAVFLGEEIFKIVYLISIILIIIAIIVSNKKQERKI
jgi:drug/metabolite transporter (DMT)-like permease